MKQKDIALLIAVVVFSAIASLVVSHYVFASPGNRQQTYAVVEVVKSDFPLPDARYFNKNSVNPTQLIQIGTTTNTNPFNGATN
ncbi:MAG TPA: hypothetical protein VLG47_06950 [Candidatus Saccharimonadales bacterium]|nr:hypothetical protein [Candidatus Saccharimonadales bacterium]